MVKKALKPAGETLISNGDFIKIEYTGKDKFGNVFDSTRGEIAKKLHSREGPILIVFGHDMLLPGLNEALKMMQKGQGVDVTLPPEQAFGMRRKELVKVFTETEFHKFDLMPQPGLPVEMETADGKLIGVIKSVNSGRVVVDFNHPLTDQTVIYHLHLLDIAHEAKDKINFLLEELQLSGEIKIENKKAVITIKSTLNEQKKNQLSYAITGLIFGIEEVEIIEPKESKENKQESKQEHKETKKEEKHEDHKHETHKENKKEHHEHKEEE